MTTTGVMELLKENKNERGIEHWKKKALKTKLLSFGLGLTQLRKISKKIGRDHELAQQLWKSNVYDAKIVGLLIDDPKLMTREQIEKQVEDVDAGYLAHVFSSCDATLAKTPFALEVASDWRDSKDATRRRCAWGLIYESSKLKGKKAPGDDFFLECIDRIEKTIHEDRDMWVRESMNGALFGIGKRNKKLNKRAIKAAKAIGPVDVDYGDDNDCEPIDVLKHLTSDYVKKKLGT
ncbi:MAG: DNA alkylation repair protein [Planctomycetota bacterium]|nr:DNA alkylation repair protein [Planctomycetota bacterium]